MRNWCLWPTVRAEATNIHVRKLASEPWMQAFEGPGLRGTKVYTFGSLAHGHCGVIGP